MFVFYILIILLNEKCVYKIIAYILYFCYKNFDIWKIFFFLVWGHTPGSVCVKESLLSGHGGPDVK